MSAPTGDHGGLRGAVEALAARWERDNRRPENAGDMVAAGVWSATKHDIADLRATLAAHPVPEPAQVGEVAAVLAEHLWFDRKRQTCSCGWDYDRDDIEARLTQWTRHVAAVLAAAGVTR